MHDGGGGGALVFFAPPVHIWRGDQPSLGVDRGSECVCALLMSALTTGPFSPSVTTARDRALLTQREKMEMQGGEKKVRGKKLAVSS